MYRELTIPEKLFDLASDHIGLQEIKGGKHNRIIVSMFDDIGHSWVKNDETAWCSAFINYIAKEAGVSMSGKLNARSWLGVGEPIENPLPGDVVIFWRESKDDWRGHVGLFCGYNSRGDIFCLGGNQGNEVNISLYKSERLLGFRRLLR